ncbi:MAG: DUF429 domain-containing protein [Pseudomonadota bacterium]|nr:DUF429 domain-containing protein [Pseudomonadota bacterium]
MVWIAGADGCKKGWFRVSLKIDTFEFRYDCVERAWDLLESAPYPEVLGLDIPIGLEENKARECDKEARKCLGRPRSSSVFPSPIRPTLVTESYDEACRKSKKYLGKKIPIQTYCLFPKIREVDGLLQKNKMLLDKVIEVHPEVSFWKWANKPMEYNKKTREGKEERLKLVNDTFKTDVFGNARKELKKRGLLKQDVADDDILDAFATLWTARRWKEGKALYLPKARVTDKAGLPMQIVF